MRFSHGYRRSNTRLRGLAGGRLTLIAADLELKHQHMAEGVFPFLRATFYRWIQAWPASCPDLAAAPTVLAVGDLHSENFGTWRDAEGRLIWGLNDFDEVYPMPYTIDLVRLATSVCLAIEEDHLTLLPDDACKAILKGYQETLSEGGRPFVLAEKYPVLRAWATARLAIRESSGRKSIRSRVSKARRCRRRCMKCFAAICPSLG